MSFWTFVFMVCLLVFSVPLLQTWTRHLERTSKQSSKYSAEIEALQQEVARLRERTEVLEAIVTDRRFALGQEIDALEHRATARGRNPPRPAEL
jgi:uncharacterized protein YlxW (UPF0749 family)